ncbi:MATE family efflux transporter [Ancylobacter lacus]|uniref:MATE family efflux transporter n=1 Tax=Ancylobacter lacus TaxID=2579970 RepID=UPI001BD0A7F0|nr:MATE family efflux transporter [Ancylobacter lacus]MBS7539634.1 polysaccharide biosynthesis C-terminal domain-containing protein [Ancylobacter lacus]
MSGDDSTPSPKQPAPGRRPGAGAARLVEGSTLRHVAVMTGTGSIGLVAVFVVDLLNLFYISLLGEQELAAAIGYAGTMMFFMTSAAVGVMIAGSALVARAVGAGHMGEARRLSASAMVYMVATTGALSLALLPFQDALVGLLGATGRTRAIADQFLWIVVPSTALLGIGMAASGVLRAVGDARRAMWVTLGGGIATAILDPLFILLMGWGVEGAAYVSVISRLFMAVYGIHAVVRVHGLAEPPSVDGFRRDVGPLSAIAVPAILTNIATPFGNGYITFALASHGDAAVAAWAVIGRVIPVAFGPLFALTGAIGPIIGQNVGALRFDRVRQAIADSLKLTIAYVLFIWAMMALARHPIATSFGLSGEGAEVVSFFCLYGAGSFIFIGALFVANASFNNLGAPLLSTLFNWGRATLGTVPFVALGGELWGAVGVLGGQAVGSIAFGVAALFFAFRQVRRLAERQECPAPPVAPGPRELPPFARAEDAAALEP